MKFLAEYNRHLLFLLLIAFAFISSSALALSGKISVVATPSVVGSKKEFAPLPTFSASESFPVLSAQAALAVDAASGVTLYEKNPDSPLLPASTTKIITALVAMDYYPLDAVIRVGNISVPGQKMGLVYGEEIRVEDLLYGLLVFSGNDAAEVLSQNYPGGREVFITAMNLKARELNLENTNFGNPAGFDGNGHLTTARDMVRLAEASMNNEKFAKIVGTKDKVVRSVDGRIIHRLTNINRLLGEVEGVIGVKTGWTENARENLVTFVERDGREIAIVILGSQDRFGETKEIIDWVFANYEWQEVDYP